MLRALKWLYPGMRIKRWLAVAIVGVLMLCLGSVALVFAVLGAGDAVVSSMYAWATVSFVVGGFFFFTGLYRFMKSLTGLVDERAGKKRNLVDVAFEQRYLGLGPKIVAIGGGTGLSLLLSGLKKYTSQITAVVSVADDGGSSGRLRQEFDMLPPGDIRKCLVALSDESEELGELMRYRFSGEDAAGNPELAGHSVGNLFLTALWRLKDDFAGAVRQAGKILSIRGSVLPASLDRVSLEAEYIDGSQVVGQRLISESEKRIKKVRLQPNPGPVSKEIVFALREADLIVLGPGSLYTSILPNLLVEGLTEAILRADATKVYVANVATSEGETRGFSLSDHLDAIAQNVSALPFDLVLVNSNIPTHTEVKEWGAAGVNLLSLANENLGAFESKLRFIEEDLISAENATRHDAAKVARALMKLLAAEREAA